MMQSGSQQVIWWRQPDMYKSGLICKSRALWLKHIGVHPVQMPLLKNSIKEFQWSQLWMPIQRFTRIVFPIISLEHLELKKKKGFSDHCKIPSTLHWNVKISYDRFSFWWVLGFVIPPLRQLAFPERVWLLAERGHARNITIWPASSHALLTQTHTWKNNGVTGVAHFKLSATTWSRHEPTDTCASKNTQLARMDHPGAHPQPPPPPTKDLCSHGGSQSWIGWRGYSRASDNLSTAR